MTFLRATAWTLGTIAALSFMTAAVCLIGYGITTLK